MYPCIQCFPLHPLRPYLTKRQGQLHLQKMKLVSDDTSAANLLLLTECLISGSWCAVCRWEAANTGSCDTSTLGQTFLACRSSYCLRKTNRRMLSLRNKLSLPRNKSYATFSKFLYINMYFYIYFKNICVYIHRTGLKSNNSDLILPCYWFNQHFILFVTAFSVEIITFYNGKFKRIKNYFQKYQINHLINEHLRKNVQCAEWVYFSNVICIA